HNGFLEGAILLTDQEPDAFDPEDLPYVEALGSRMVVAWQNDYNRLNLAELVESAASLSTTLNPNQLLDRVADIARRSTKATFALVAIREDDEWKTGSGGKAPLMFDTTRSGLYTLLDEVQKTGVAMRVRDIRKDHRTRHLPMDVGDFRTMLATPIVLDQQQTGVILVFGKKTATVFSEQDEFLLNLLGSHAVVSIERCLLDEELRSTLKSTQLFYDLSIRIAESGDLTTAAYVIGRTAFRLFQATNCGLVLYAENGQMEASVLFPIDDEPGISHPEDLIRQAMETRQIAYQGARDLGSRLAFPIQTQRRCYGALWLELGDSSQHTHRPVEEIRILINQSAVALERSILLAETRQQTEQIATAYHQLEESYDQTLLALTNALEARDHETETHTQRVSTISLSIGKELGLSPEDLTVLKRGALLHDIGKIGISDNILRKSGQLDSSEWNLMQKHPSIIANHHERWNGSGYPNGLVGEEIPLLARIFIVADVYDALTSHRPYRVKDFSHEDAIAYIKSQAGILFDPNIVGVLERVLGEDPGLSV
ncbi:MAG TPA: HD domain-containing protein, partial [Anaerolinea sp.]|nr:HD domain-containing protein [Anaerolinea sp.]